MTKNELEYQFSYIPEYCKNETCKFHKLFLKDRKCYVCKGYVKDNKKCYGVWQVVDNKLERIKRNYNDDLEELAYFLYIMFDTDVICIHDIPKDAVYVTYIKI